METVTKTDTNYEVTERLSTITKQTLWLLQLFVLFFHIKLGCMWARARQCMCVCVCLYELSEKLVASSRLLWAHRRLTASVRNLHSVCNAASVFHSRVFFFSSFCSPPLCMLCVFVRFNYILVPFTGTKCTLLILLEGWFQLAFPHFKLVAIWKVI